jgi:hypothetical protein
VIDDFAFLPHRQEISLPYDFSREIQRRVVVYHN